MFNLLVTGASGWSSSRDVMSQGRTLEFTAGHIEQRFMRENALDIDAVIRLPTLFACENSWDGNHIPARVGTLTRIQLLGGEYHLEYVLDPDIPPIPNEVLFGAAARDLDINTTASISESSRNHWSIKDVDLFRTILKYQSGFRVQPKEFSIPNVGVDSSLVAVMMPFGGFDSVYQAIRSACSDAGLNCLRADDIWENSSIIQDIFSLIYRAQIVVVDFSNKNPNVMYETGIAHTLGKTVIPIAQAIQDIPSDMVHHRALIYHNNGEGLQNLESELTEKLRNSRI
jgi:hypothetical protein|tara:strand:+ start:819 stop:1673 length:855 start_codon:yes stop_codon:yes gene_type:complete